MKRRTVRSRLTVVAAVTIATALVVLLGASSLRWVGQTVSANPAGLVELVHVNPDGSDYSGNPFCPETVWSGGEVVSIDPRHDCNNLASQRHVIRTDGFDRAATSDWQFNREGVGTVESPGGLNGVRCGDLAEVTSRPDWDPANDDEQCVVIHSKDTGETRVTFTYTVQSIEYTTLAVFKEWDRLTDTVILKAADVENMALPDGTDALLPKDANGNSVRDATDTHLMDHNGETQDHSLIFDDARKRLKSSLGPIRLIEQVHGQHGISGWEADHPTEGAVILAFIDSPMGCTYFSNPFAVVIGGVVYQAGELNLGTAVVGMSDWRGFFAGPKIWPAGAQLSAEALAEAVAHNLEPGLSNNSSIPGVPFFEADYTGVYVDTECEEQATITFKVGYPDYVQSVPQIPEPEWVEINWTTVQMAKQPQIRWAGEEIVLEKRWALPDDWYPEPGGGLDNDADTLINEDPADDDGDGLIDEDPNECANAVDDDGDTYVNDGCPKVGAASETLCTNAIDDDNDGWVNDGCIEQGARGEDEIDSDNDGMEDGSGPLPGLGDCNDGIDNDADTKVDEDDTNCKVFIDEDTGGPEDDNDGDGLIDEDGLDICPVAGRIVKYQKLGGPGGLESGIPDLVPPSPDVVWTYVDDECVSRAVYSSEEPGQVDVEATQYNCSVGDPWEECTSVQNKHAFLIWYIKIYQVKLTNVPGERRNHNAGKFSVGEGADLYDPSAGDVEEETLNVSQDALLRVRVKGWFYGGNNSSRGAVCVDRDGDGDGAGTEPGVPYPTFIVCDDADDEMLPAGYWVLPDDLVALAGPDPVSLIPSWDVMSEPDVAASSVIGPKSTLDSHDNVPRVVVPCVQPKTVGGVMVPDWTCTRKTVDPDGKITEADALMPPLKILVQLGQDAPGFLKPAVKGDGVGISSAYQSVMIPANPEIPPIVNNGGYDWDSWGWNVVQYDYPFFRELSKTTQDGFIRGFQFYTDNRGEGFFFANGDYNLSFDDCVIQALFGTPDCEPGDVVGASIIQVIGDYPYFRKHPAVQSNPVTKTWIWGGYNEVTAVAIDAAHTAIIAHVKDRDGYCKWDVNVGSDIGATFSPSLHPVEGEEITFILHSQGAIVDVSDYALFSVAPTPLGDATVVGAADGAILAGRKEAVGLAEDVRVLDGMETLGMVGVGYRDPIDGPESYVPECQAWIVIEHVIGADPELSIYFDGPEGVVVRDWPPSDTFAPTFSATVSDDTAAANADVVMDFGIPGGDFNFSAVVTFTPPEFFVASDVDITDGAHVGDLDSLTTLGLLNAPCTNALNVSFQMLDATTDTSTTVSFADSYVDFDGNGLDDGVDRYPDFLNIMFPGITPRARSFGHTQAAGTDVTMNFVIFEPGTALPNLPAFDPSLGYPSVTVLNNPLAALAPSPITDFCSPLATTGTSFGLTEDNPDTAADESGQVYRTNPTTGGDYTSTAFARSLLDADGDHIENELDTCPFDVNEGDPRVAGSGDTDSDGIDNVCDPTPDEPLTDHDGDGYMNRGDNCPLVANGPGEDNQADADYDGIGDACDLSPNTPDGEPQERTLSSVVTICDPSIDRDGDGVGDACDPDDDNDGIADEVDVDPFVFSNAFSDVPLEGTTWGDILDRGGLAVEISEEPNPDGVRIVVTGGGGQATVSACGDFILELTPLDNTVVTCGSLTVDVFVGPVTASFGSFVANLPAGTTATVTETAPGVFEVTNDPGSTVPISVNGVEIPPGSTETDGDGDGFFTSVEQYVGTDPLDDCPDVLGSPGLCPGPSCDGDDAWPPDLDVDTEADIADVLKFKPLILYLPCEGDPEYDERFDFNANGCINIADVLLYKPVILTSCTPGAILNCPQPGKWAISVWEGADGTDTGQALGTCGEGAVDFAYYIGPGGQWQRYIAGRPEISTLLTLDNVQGIIAHGSVAASAPSGPELSVLAAQDGTMQNCPQAGEWAISVWDGPDGTDATEALNTCGEGAVGVAYYLDPFTQAWQRWFRDRPELSTLHTLNDRQGVIALGGTIEESCAPVIPGTYNGAVTVGGPLAPDGTSVTVSIDGTVWGTTTTSGGRYVVDVPASPPATAPCFPGAGTVTFACDGIPAAETATWSAGLYDLDLTCAP